MGRPPVFRTQYPQESIFLLDGSSPSSQPQKKQKHGASQAHAISSSKSISSPQITEHSSTTTKEHRQFNFKTHPLTNTFKIDLKNDPRSKYPASSCSSSGSNSNRNPPPSSRRGFTFHSSKEQHMLNYNIERIRREREEQERLKYLEMERIRRVEEVRAFQIREKIDFIRKLREKRDRKLVNYLYLTPIFVATTFPLPPPQHSPKDDDDDDDDDEKKQRDWHSNKGLVTTVIKTRKSAIYIQGDRIPEYLPIRMEDGDTPLCYDNKGRIIPKSGRISMNLKLFFPNWGHKDGLKSRNSVFRAVPISQRSLFCVASHRDNLTDLPSSPITTTTTTMSGSINDGDEYEDDSSSSSSEEQPSFQEEKLTPEKTRLPPSFLSSSSSSSPSTKNNVNQLYI